MKRIKSFPTLRQLALIILIPLLELTGELPGAGQETQEAKQSTQGPRPGASDPLGKPGRYTILPSHELMTVVPNGNEYQLKPFAADKNLRLTPIPPDYSYPSDPGSNQISAASGRILAPDPDRVGKPEQVVLARRSGSNVAVSFFGPASPSPSLVIPGLADRMRYSADFIDIAVADLDKLPDASGNNHDEVVVVYASPASGNWLEVNLKVLDYTSDALDPYPTPVAVTSATMDPKIDAESFVYDVTYGRREHTILPVDNVLAVAVGDFDGDTQNEIAVLYLPWGGGALLKLFRYTNDGAGNRSLRQVVQTGFGALELYRDLSGTVDLVAGDFNGDGRDELIAATAPYHTDASIPLRVHYNYELNAFQSDTKFNLTKTNVGGMGSLGRQIITFNDVAARMRLELTSGLFRFDPGQGYGLGRRQVALAWNRENRLGLHVVTIGDQLTQIAEHRLDLPINARQRFALAAGALRGNDSLNEAVWSLALGSWAEGGAYQLSTIKFDAGVPSLAAQQTVGSAAIDAAARFPVVPFDARGKSLYLGAPIHLTADNMITTDFVIQEPPKHAFYDNRPTVGGQTNPNFGKVVNVSRDDDFHVELIDEKKTTLSSKSTDTSAKSIGASASLTAKETLKAGVGGIKVSLSAEVSAKVGYDYDQNKKSYNSQYSERALSYGGQTNREDYLAGRLQLFDIWRYRIYGVVGATDDAGATDAGGTENAFYDLVLPGPALDFQGGASIFDWYQPVHENGNILSYPRPTDGFFTPADLGSYRLPCDDRVDAACVPCDRTTDKACGLYGTKIIREPLIPASRQAWTGNQTFVALNFTNTATSGRERSTDKTLSESADVKVSVGAKASSLGASVSIEGTVEVEQHGKFSWGNAVTAESASTSGTGITLRTSQGNANQGYPFFPVFYSAADGTTKAAHAVEVLGGSASQRQFWAGIYGGKPDPALNLPGRFQSDDSGSKQHWVPNTYLNRKAMRGFFLRHPDPNPITGEYGYLAGAPLLGDRVRLEARVYNYSTGRAAEGLVARFQIVQLDESTYAEIDPRTNEPLADPYLQLHPSLRTTIGETFVGTLSPLEWKAASLVWDSKATPPPGAGTIPAGAAQLYRVYVVLDPDDAINEIYDTELPGQFDPSQNNEGYSDISVMRAPALSAQADRPRDAQLRGESLAAFEIATSNGNASAYRTGQVRAYLGVPLRLRVRVFSDHSDPDLSPLLVYDGDPEQGGQVIAGKLVPSGDAVDGASSFIEWTPRTLGAHTLYARLLTDPDDPNTANNTAQLLVNVVPFDTIAPGLEVTLTPNVLWPTDGRMALVTANIRVRDDLDPHPVIKLESITSSETRLGAIDIREALLGTDDRQFLLRAQNLTALGPERAYTVTYSATDWAGNKTLYSATIRVRR